MYQTIAITPVTMKRLLNYQRVIERETNTAASLQWKTMTSDNMRRCEQAKQKAAHIAAIVAYAGFLFRVQNKLLNYRVLHSEFSLQNGLVELMNELHVSIDWVEVEFTADDASYKNANGKQ